MSPHAGNGDDPDSPLEVDPARAGLGGTGIYVRARSADAWGSHDIAALTRDSLQRWLRSRGGENPWAESVVAIMLGHEPWP